MSDELKTSYPDEIQRGRAAKELLENELLNKVLAEMEAEIVAAWGKAPVRDAEGKEELWKLYRTAQKFRDMLKKAVQDGEFAKRQLDEINANPTMARLRRVVGI